MSIRLNRASMRLSAYDYSEPGAYFVTICLDIRSPLLGSVDSPGSVALSSSGTMVQRLWMEIERQFPGTLLNSSIIMPDHVHGIVMLGADPGNVSPVTLGRVVQWFKTVSTKRYGEGVRRFGWPAYDGRLWQRGYYDHVIRNDNDFRRCQEYIEANPWRWLEKNAVGPD